MGGAQIAKPGSRGGLSRGGLLKGTRLLDVCSLCGPGTGVPNKSVAYREKDISGLLHGS